MNLSIIILAAGKGKRMATSLPKVLHKLGGFSLLEWVVKTSQQLSPSSINVVYGNAGGLVKNQLSHLPVNWVEQQDQLGTGHAVLQALPNVNDNDRVLVLFGDVPLISKQTLTNLIDQVPQNGIGVLVAEFADPSGLGRVVRNVKGDVVAVVEERDATEVQRKIGEINTGIIIAPARVLKEWLPKLENKNDQKEYYLTDIIALSVLNNRPVKAVFARDSREVQGINDLWQLAMAERYYQQLAAKKLMLSGVKIVDPNRIDLRGEWEIGEDVTIDVNVILEGKNKIGNNTHIGANVFLKNVTIGDNVIIEANSVIEEAIIHNDCSVGPFARLRPGTVLKERAKVGNFVETKKTTIGSGSKANHLTYLGDTVIGKGVNIGAGTITCNYDGVNKFPTVIHDGAFIGSNTSLVAPIEVGKNATIGAGSTVSKAVPAEKLTIARNKQTTIENWHRPVSVEPHQPTDTNK